MHLPGTLQIRSSVSSFLAARFMTLLFKTRAHGPNLNAKSMALMLIAYCGPLVKGFGFLA